MLVGLTGIIVGGGLAFILGYTQMEYGWMAIEGGETFAVEAYPLRLKVLDFVTVSVTVMVLSLLAAVGPAIKAAGYTVVEGLRR
jgi:lipoprotein-releasing system permease protein